VNITVGGRIEVADYNDLALEINRIFSDNTTSLGWSTSNIILNTTASPGGETAGATRDLTLVPAVTDFLVVTVNDITLFETVDYSLTYTDPAVITYLGALPASAALKVYNRTTHRYGWGQQASIYPITAGNPILADEATLQAYLEANINNIIDKVNIIETRIDGPSTITRIAPGAIIFASDKLQISSVIDTDILTTDNYWQNTVATVFSGVTSFSRTSDWNNILIGEMRHTWDDYDSLRYFLNAGNEIRYSIDSAPDLGSQGARNWAQVCDAMGTIVLNYNATTGTTGTATGLGAFNLTSTYQTIFTSGSPATPFDSIGEYDVYGSYSALIVVTEARIVENLPSAGNVSVDIRITLNDFDLNTTTIGSTTVSGGYKIADNVNNNSAVFSSATMAPTVTVLNSFESTSTTAITNITNASPGVVTIADTSVLTNGSIISITGVVGMTEVNSVSYTVTIINATTFSIGVDTTAFTAYTSGGLLTYQTDDN
jgi:hypothetical protein